MRQFSGLNRVSGQRPGLRLALLAAAAVSLALGCGDVTPTSPDVTGPLASVHGRGRDHAWATDHASVRALAAGSLAKCEPLPYDSVTKTIGRKGGVIRVGPHMLLIPRGALESNVTITAVVPSDTINMVQFQPEGLVFDKSPTLTMQWGNCAVGRMGKKVKIAYLDDALNVVQYLPSRSHERGRSVSTSLEHFSNYAVAF